jgi:hypothetical protein
MPAWDTVAISIGAALITGAAALGGSILQGRHQREQQLRERRIDAAGDFSTSALQAIGGIRDAVRTSPSGEPAAERKSELAVLGLLHEAEAHVGRVSFLFAAQSGVAEAAATVKERLHAAELAVGREPFQAVQDKADAAECALDGFNAAVLKLLEEEPSEASGHG